jgi:TonB-linked SusC/RagA family outer membrane protein
MIAYYMKMSLVVVLAVVSLHSRAHPQSRPLPIQEALRRVTKTYGTQFVYDPQLLSGKTTTYQVRSVQGRSVEDVLKEILYPNELVFLYVSPNYYTIVSKDRVGEASKSYTSAAGTAVSAPVSTPAARQVVVTGTVRDNAGAPLSRVTVNERGTSNTVFTNEDGSFRISVSSEAAVLVFSFVGFDTREVAANGAASLNVTLVQNNTSLGEVVVVGYGTQRRASVTGAVDRISGSALQNRPVVNVAQALQGVSPNLIIQQRNFEPGQELNINIRGLGTLGNNSPLVVIDGIIGGDLNLLNPNDIESISVLKDAGSAAIYGSRSANGVLLITTKKGRKNEKPSVTLSAMYGIQSPRITYEPVHAWENAYFKNESLYNSGRQPVFTPTEIAQFKERGDGTWRLSNIMRNAPQQNHNISISGGSANSTYLMSFGYMDQESNFVGPNYGYKRYNVRLNQSTDIGRLRVTTLLSYVRSEGKDHSTSSQVLVVDAGRVPLYYSFQDSAGRYLTNAVSAEFNPKAMLENGGYRRSKDDEVFGSVTGEFSITSALKLRGVFGGTIRNNHRFGRRLPLTFSPGGQYGQDREVFDDNYKSLLTNTQLIAEYNKTFQAHEVRLLVGASNESFGSERNQLLKTLTDPALGTPTTGTVINPSTSFNTNQGTVETSINSLFGRAGYSFNNRYNAEFNFRYDGSSNFAKQNRWGFFPSVAASWRASEEGFLQGFKNSIGDLKVRASYGLLGNQNVRPYQYQTSFFNYQGAYGFNDVAVGGSGYNLGNPDLTWEKAATFNIGVDATLLQRRLDLSFDYFSKTTSDILVQRRDVPLLFGASFPDFNTAEVRNKGWEARAVYRLPGKLFSHTFSANIADNNNELLSFTFGAAELVERREEFEFVRRVGYPITVYQGYRRDGYFQTLDDINKSPTFPGSTVTAGDIRFKDKNGDGVIDDNDKYILGNPFPRYTFGFTYTVAVKGFDVLLFVQGVGKREAMLRGELVEPFHFGYGGTMYRHQTDYWTPTNPNARYPRLAEAGSPSNSNNYRTGSDIYLFDAAYGRLKNVQVGYTLPASIAAKARIQRARIYFTGQNLLTVSKLQFMDPETTEFDNSTSFNTGANSARAYPLPVFYGFGLDITF